MVLIADLGILANLSNDIVEIPSATLEEMFGITGCFHSVERSENQGTLFNLIAI